MCGHTWHLPAAHTHLLVGTDEEGLDFDAVADHGHSGAGGGGDDGVSHPGTAQRRGEGSGLGECLGLAAGCWHMAHGVVGGGEGWAGVLDTDHGGLLECWGLLGWPVPAWGDRKAVWNQSLWPNLGREAQLHGQMDTHTVGQQRAWWRGGPGQSQNSGRTEPGQ